MAQKAWRLILKMVKTNNCINFNETHLRCVERTETWLQKDLFISVDISYTHKYFLFCTFEIRISAKIQSQFFHRNRCRMGLQISWITPLFHLSRVDRILPYYAFTFFAVTPWTETFSQFLCVPNSLRCSKYGDPKDLNWGCH